ncbi:MAG TPA: ChaN family lipoprotein [Burkholderiaceae bacterium]|nr:ChaN family lipoprotein [Burkholderiaceae bacterium]
MRGPRAALRDVLAAAAVTACAAPVPETGDFTAPVVAAQMQRRPVVLLGEIHDNAAQHAVRAQALALLLRAGARPALAFEQFDRERQADIDRVLAQAPADGVDRAEQLAALGARGWNWALYRPFLELALQYRLPIVAANLSRTDALRVSKEGFGAVFDAARQRELGLDSLPADLLRAQEEAVDEGHCHQLAADMLPALARAQIARDAALAQAIRPYLQRGVVLLTGNGHIRRDIGVAHFLPAQQQDRIISIALLEHDSEDDAVPPGAFDEVFRTPRQARADPCQALRRQTLSPTPLPHAGEGGRP